MKVCLIFRKKDPVFFSIENVFNLIEPFLQKYSQLHKLVVPFFSNGLVAIGKNLLSARKLIPADVYHITGDVLYMALMLPRSKTVVTIHDCNYLNQVTGIKRKVIKWLYLEMPVKRARIVTAISEQSKQEVLHHCKCDPSKVVVINNPLSEHIYHVPAKFNAVQPVVLFIGSTPNKNLERTIEALKGISCKLVIVGKINATQQSLLEAAGVVYETKHSLTDQQIADQYAACDLMLFASTYEGFGMPIIEAQKAGRVVITSNVSPMKEVAATGAVLVDPEDVASIKQAVLQVIKDEALRQQLIAEGFKNIGRYEASHIADQYKAVYDLVVNSKN